MKYCVSDNLPNRLMPALLCFSKKTEQDVSLKLPERGSVLVFLPGLREIGNMQEALATLARRRWNRFVNLT